jgi:hypothetical protein
MAVCLLEHSMTHSRFYQATIIIFRSTQKSQAILAICLCRLIPRLQPEATSIVRHKQETPQSTPRRVCNHLRYRISNPHHPEGNTTPVIAVHKRNTTPSINQSKSPPINPLPPPLLLLQRIHNPLIRIKNPLILRVHPLLSLLQIINLSILPEQISALVLELPLQSLNFILKSWDVGAVAALAELVDVPGGLIVVGVVWHTYWQLDCMLYLWLVAYVAGLDGGWAAVRLASLPLIAWVFAERGDRPGSRTRYINLWLAVHVSRPIHACH